MSLSDFLFSGSPPPAVTTYGSTTSSIPPWFEDYQQGLLNKSNVVAAEPYQAFQAPSQDAYAALAQARQAPFTPATQTGWNMGQTAATAYQPMQTAAENATTGALAMPNASQAAAPVIGGALSGPTGLGSANPYLTAGTQTWPSAVSDYMNPYTDAAGKYITDQSNQNLLHNILPSISNGFVGSGMLGSTQNGQFMNNAIQNQQQTLTGALGTNFQNQWNAAGQQFNADQSRDITAGQTAGNLASSDMQNKLSAASLQGNLANASQTTAGTLGQDLGALGTKAQTNGLTGASIYEGIGNQQQGKQQQLLDTMYNNFQNQTQYPEQQLSFMNDMIRGLNPPTSTSTTTTAPASNYSASPFAQILGAGIGLQGLLGSGTTSHKRGGHIKGYARGGHTGDHWIKSAIEHPGALHAEMHIPQGQHIPADRLARAAHSDNPLLARRAHLAETMRHFAQGGSTGGGGYQYSRIVPGGYGADGRYQPEMEIPGGMNLHAYAQRLHGEGMPTPYSGYLTRDEAAALPGRAPSFPAMAPLGALAGR